jgi:hypothetical protein
MSKGASDQIRALRERRYEEIMAKVDVINTVNNTGTKRQAKWRAANIELNRQRAREGMRKKRASNKLK